ncbi:MAG: hypothetical protein ACOH2D_06800 [Gelidibacter sp.]
MITKHNINLSRKKTSNYDILYLKKMIELCKKNNVKVVFVRSPYHEKFIGRKYESLFQMYRKENFENIDFLDCKDFEIENFEFADLQHLNYKGANKFSIWFEKLINQ